MPNQPLPPCPLCKSNRQVRAIGTVGDQFFCGRGGMCGLFDNEPDEGGSHDDYRADARVIRGDVDRECRRDRVEKFKRL